MQDVGKHLDPICGMTVDPATAAGSFAHGGKGYYFCSVHCLEKFRRDPEAWLEKSAAPTLVEPIGISRARSEVRQAASPPSISPQSYTCPMHPEVRQPASGSCPSCGMALEPLNFSASPTKVEFTCPMHPEVVRDAPGSCPICGMALEPRTVTLDELENPELREMTRRFWISVALTLPLLLIGMSEFVPSLELERLLPMRVWSWLQLALATPVVLWGAAPFFVRGWQSIVNRSLNMFTLIGLGVSVAYVFSVIAVGWPPLF